MYRLQHRGYGKDSGWYLEEDVGDKPVKYTCVLSSCIDEQGYCPMCGQGASRMEKLAGYDEWKQRYDSRKIIRFSTDYNHVKSFIYNGGKCNNSTVEESEIFIKDNIAYPIIQLELFN